MSKHEKEEGIAKPSDVKRQLVPDPEPRRKKSKRNRNKEASEAAKKEKREYYDKLFPGYGSLRFRWEIEAEEKKARKHIKCVCGHWGDKHESHYDYPEYKKLTCFVCRNDVGGCRDFQPIPESEASPS